MAREWLSIPHTGFGTIRFECYRDDGAPLSPEWVSRRRIVPRPRANGGVKRQFLGWNDDQIVFIVDVLDAENARALRAMEGTTDTLVLREETGSDVGTSVSFIHTGSFRSFANVTLASLEPLGMRRNGRYRFRVTFEKAHV